ncbi:AT-hook motif nuclear-localized protein 10-like [Phalaenopsis equestris]|uniref:AT-hook motif nuclear-localized protein 10-like n=1 Tax=Phalaenopsis equestris TaxID=78828 RepID=UPI0009E2C7B6|nr:AT-hook motif nuclear-localized protein 10-like [Phalaenopsis equestris]
MEGRESVVFFGSEGFGGVKNTPSLTPSPVSSPSPPPSLPHAGGIAGVGGEAGSFIGHVGGGSSGGAAVAAAAASRVDGMAMGMGMGMGLGMGSIGSSFSGGSEELMKKKRGRPKKLGPESMELALTARSSSPFSSGSKFSAKGPRGRPRGTGRCQLLAALGEWFQLSAGGSFTPHVVSIAAGEDVAARILSFSQKGPRAVCILSANGAISNVTLRQPGSSGGTLTFEGRFEILSLSGSFTITDFDGVRSRTGGISISLAGPDGRVIGGGVAGLLLAASPIQVVVGSFLPNAFKEHKRKLNQDSSPFPSILPSSCTADVAPLSHATEECEDKKSTIQDPTSGGTHSNVINITDLNPPSFRSVHWQGMQPSSEQKSSPDINVCLRE